MGQRLAVTNQSDQKSAGNKSGQRSTVNKNQVKVSHEKQSTSSLDTGVTSLKDFVMLPCTGITDN